MLCQQQSTAGLNDSILPHADPHSRSLHPMASASRPNSKRGEPSTPSTPSTTARCHHCQSTAGPAHPADPVVATPVLEAETVEEKLEEASGPDSDFGIELEVSSDED